jgi:hypothetical protein
MTKSFNTASSDSQGTQATPINPKDFDHNAYAAYEAELLERNRQFWQADNGVAVYRRFRVPECFTWMSRDMQASLAHQLGALQASMTYKADIANFLEPWYGIGTLASAFGIDYLWPEGQAPVVPHAFASVQDVLAVDPVPIEKTAIGKQTLAMIEYFLEATQGKLPVSLTDTQSPLNALSFLVDTNAFYMGFIDAPDELKVMLDRLVPLQVAFVKKQIALIGDAIAWPGHGFASSRAFSGLGMSDDIMTLLSPPQYAEFGVPSLTQCSLPFGGPVVHSCGNWCDKVTTVKDIEGLVMIDGAFTPETDPAPNDTQPFKETFHNTSIVLNTRMVGNFDTVIETVKALWQPPMKLIVVTYCETPEEQAQAYDRIHDICQS